MGELRLGDLVTVGWKKALAKRLFGTTFRYTVLTDKDHGVVDIPYDEPLFLSLPDPEYPWMSTFIHPDHGVIAIGLCEGMEVRVLAPTNVPESPIVNLLYLGLSKKYLVEPKP